MKLEIWKGKRGEKQEAITERRDSQSLCRGHRSYSPLHQPATGPPAINHVDKAVLEPTLFLLPPNNMPDTGKDLAQISAISQQSDTW